MMRTPIATVMVIGALVLNPATAAVEEKFEALKERAEGMLDQDRRRVAETEHVVVVTDAPEPEVARVLAMDLESVFAATHRLLKSKLPPRSQSRKLQTYLFVSEYQYVRFLGSTKSVGSYFSPGLVTFHQERVTRPELLGTAIHEGVHAYLDMYIVNPDIELPLWLNEGLASYMQYSVIEEGKIQPGVFYKKQRYDHYQGLHIDFSLALLKARRLNATLKKDKLSLEELLSADVEEFTGESRVGFYDGSWGLVHFLRHGVVDGSEEFLELLRDVVNGVGFEDALRDNYDLTITGLEDAFKAYVKTSLTHPPTNPKGSLRRQ